MRASVPNLEKNNQSDLKSSPQFNDFPTEIILQIFNYFSPKELAGLSYVCKNFNRAAKMPSLGLNQIQQGFFRANLVELKNKIEKGMDHFTKQLDLNANNPEWLIKQKRRFIKIKNGLATIGKKEVNFLDLFAHHLIDRYFSFTSISNDKAKLCRSMLILLLESGVSVTTPYKDSQSNLVLQFRKRDYLEGKTALEYAQAYANQHPEIYSIVAEYHKFSERQKVRLSSF